MKIWIKIATVYCVDSVGQKCSYEHIPENALLKIYKENNVMDVLQQENMLSQIGGNRRGSYSKP